MHLVAAEARQKLPDESSWAVSPDLGQKQTTQTNKQQQQQQQ